MSGGEAVVMTATLNDLANKPADHSAEHQVVAEQVRLGEPARPEKQADVLTAAHRTGHAATEPVQAEMLVVDP